MERLLDASVVHKDARHISLLQHVVGILDTYSFPYYIVGSTGANALMGKDVPVRSDGTTKDVDVLTPCPDGVEELLKKEGLLKTSPQDRKADLGINNYLNLTNPNKPQLQYKSITVSLPEEIFSVTIGEIEGIKIPTLPAETLFHLYALPGSLRKDDWSIALELGRWIRANPRSDLDEECYRKFHEYNKLVQKRYRLQALMWKMDRSRNVEGKRSIVNYIKYHFPWSKPILGKVRNMINDTLGKIS